MSYFSYRLHKPQLRGRSVNSATYSNNNSTYSVNWIKDEGIEIVVATNGKTIANKLSRLCKRELGKMFINLCYMTNNLSVFNENKPKVFYDELKNKNKNYLDAKQALISAFRVANFGTWVHAPKEFQSFELNVHKC